MVQVVLAACLTAASLVMPIATQSGLADKHAPPGTGAVRTVLLRLASLSARLCCFLAVFGFIVSIVVATLMMMLLLLWAVVLMTMVMCSSLMTAVTEVVIVTHGTCRNGKQRTKD